MRLGDFSPQRIRPLADRSCKRSLSRGCGIRMTARKIAGLAAILSVAPIANSFATKAGPAAGFSFYRDTLAFANTNVFAYEQGKIVSHRNFFVKKKTDRYPRP